MKENPLRSWRFSTHTRAVDVALKLGLSEQSILSFEKGRFKPSRDNFEKIAKLMGEDLSKLNMAWEFWLKGKRISDEGS